MESVFFAIVTVCMAFGIAYYYMSKSSLMVPQTNTSVAQSGAGLSAPQANMNSFGCTSVNGFRFPGAGYKLGSETGDAVYPGFGSNVATSDMCAFSCSTDDDCKQYTYDASAGKCYKQKNRYPYTVDNKEQNWISGTCTRNMGQTIT